MNKVEKSGFLPGQNIQQQKVELMLDTIRQQQVDRDNRAVAGVFGRFWGQTLSTPENGKVNLALQIKEADGNITYKSANATQVRDLDRKDDLWKGTVVDSGVGEAYVIVAKTDENGNKNQQTIKVLPFEYKTEEGIRLYILRPKAIEYDRNPSRGKLFRSMD